MTPVRLKEYVETYDVDLAASCVVLDTDDTELIIGLGMLGRRHNRSWITRVGVLPYTRKMGAGSDIISKLVEDSIALGHEFTWLEVIHGNKPAHRLFLKNKFKQTRELMVLRRPPGTKVVDSHLIPCPAKVVNVDRDAAIEEFAADDNVPNWLNQPETFKNIENLSIKQLTFSEGWKGRVFYEKTALQLKRVIVQVLSGPPEQVTAAVLAWLHQQFPVPDAVCENFEVNDPRIQGYLRAGYFESFRRIEMVRHNQI